MIQRSESDAQIEEMASHWLARLDREDASPEDRAAFEAWRNADPRHAAAYAELEAVWGRLDVLQETPGPAAQPAPIPLPRRRTRWVAATGLAAAAGLAALILVVALWPSSTFTPEAQRYVTAVGEHERISLADGSTVELNTDTELSVTLEDTRRHVDLPRGEATFHVVHDPERSFTVAAGGFTVRDLGTTFNVRRQDESVEVLVTEGRVALEATALKPTELKAGQLARAHDSAVEIRSVAPERLQRALAWHKGMLAFDNETLRDAADEFNRYNELRLIVDPSAADLRIGGYFQAGNVEGFVRVLEQNFAIQVTREPGGVRLSAN